MNTNQATESFNSIHISGRWKLVMENNILHPDTLITTERLNADVYTYAASHVAK